MNAAYAAERARLLFGCYRRGEANDPETYAAAVAAVLAEYPEDTIRHVTDPRTGLPSNPPTDPKTGRTYTGLPDVGHVRAACEKHHGPVRRAREYEAAERRQLAERKRLLPPSGPKKTYEELIQSCIDAGLDMGKRKKETVNVDAFLKEHGVSREVFDALPNAPDYRWK